MANYDHNTNSSDTFTPNNTYQQANSFDQLVNGNYTDMNQSEMLSSAPMMKSYDSAQIMTHIDDKNNLNVESLSNHQNPIIYNYSSFNNNDNNNNTTDNKSDLGQLHNLLEILQKKTMSTSTQNNILQDINDNTNNKNTLTAERMTKLYRSTQYNNKFKKAMSNSKAESDSVNCSFVASNLNSTSTSKKRKRKLQLTDLIPSSTTSNNLCIPFSFAHNQPKKQKVELKCEFCQKEYRSKQGFKKHYNQHLIEDNGRYHCQLCLQKYQTVQDLRMHISQFVAGIQIVNGDIQYQCCQCVTRFDSKAELSQHMTSAHKANSKNDVVQYVPMWNERHQTV